MDIDDYSYSEIYLTPKDLLDASKHYPVLQRLLKIFKKELCSFIEIFSCCARPNG